MQVTNLTLEHTYNILMRNVTPKRAHVGIKPYTRTLIAAIALRLPQAYGGYKVKR